MLRHIVLLRWNERVSDAEREATLATLNAVRDEADMLLAHHAGMNVAERGTFDVAVITDVESVEHLATYIAHPAARRAHEVLIRTTQAFEVFDVEL